MKPSISEISCEECIAFLLDYLENQMTQEAHAVFDEHLKICPNCVVYLNNYLKTVKMAGKAWVVDPSLKGRPVPISLIEKILAAARARR